MDDFAGIFQVFSLSFSGVFQVFSCIIADLSLHIPPLQLPLGAALKGRRKEGVIVLLPDKSRRIAVVLS